jgi:hypothetical protein
MGVSYPLWVLLAVLALFLCSLGEGKRPALPAYLLAAASLALSSTVALRAEEFSRAMGVLLSLTGLALLAATLTTGNWLFYRLGDIVVAGAKLFVAVIIRGSGNSSNPKPSPAQSSAEAGPAPAAVPTPGRFRNNLRRGLPFLRGALLALPVLFVLGSLLAAADPVFARSMENLFKVFDFARLPEYLFRLFYILVFAYIFTGVLLHAVLPDAVEARPDPNQPWNSRFLGSTECTIVLSAVLALFAFFIALQFRYLFGGQANIRETGFTYSDYARRGFFELVWVAVLSLGLYWGLSAVTRRQSARDQLVFRLLSIVLFSFVLIMLASALQRLMLYETAYGFTRLRTYTHILIPWLGLLFLAAIVLEAMRSPGRMALALTLTIFGFGLTFTFLNVDGLITRLNLERFRAGGELDAAHLAGLSSDAVPPLARAFSEERSQSARDQLGAALACHWINALEHAKNRPFDWRGYTFSAARSAQTLAALDLSPYLQEDQDARSGWSAKSDICAYRE